MKITELVKTKGFQEAKARVRGWKERLKDADRDEALGILDEKARFFSGMRKSDPELYAAFRLNEKELGEAIHEKLTGKKIIID